MAKNKDQLTPVSVNGKELNPENNANVETLELKPVIRPEVRDSEVPSELVRFDEFTDMLKKQPRRRVVQIASLFSHETNTTHFTVLCDDHTLWEYQTPRAGLKTEGWTRLPDVPQ